MTYETLVVERDGPVGWLVFNRPDAGQRDGRAHDGTSSRSRGASSTTIPTVRVIVNTGTGRAFQTGLDVVQLSRTPEALREQSRRTKHFDAAA